MAGVVASFIGGSAYAMAQQVAGGFVLVTELTLKRLEAGDLRLLDFELDKVLREIRGEQPAIDDMAAVQTRNRRIQRLTGCRAMIQQYRLRHRIRT